MGALSGCKGGGDSNAATPSAASSATTSSAPSAPAATTEAVAGSPSIAGAAPVAIEANVRYVFQPTASDPNGDPLSFQIENKPEWATFNTVTGELSGTPTLDHAGTYADIVISASDGKEIAALAAFAIAVNSPALAANTMAGVTLAWVAPTQKADGSVLSDLTGFIISYGSSSEALTHSVLVDNPTVDTFVFDDLQPGTYYFGVQAVTANGEVSNLSELLEKSVG